MYIRYGPTQGSGPPTVVYQDLNPAKVASTVCTLRFLVIRVSPNGLRRLLISAAYVILMILGVGIYIMMVEPPSLSPTVHPGKRRPATSSSRKVSLINTSLQLNVALGGSVARCEKSRSRGRTSLPKSFPMRSRRVQVSRLSEKY